MTVALVFAAVLVSVAAIVHFAWTDPKRRRVFGLPAYDGPRRTWPALAVLVMPGVLLLGAGDAAGFTIWLGALTVFGWGVAAVNPHRAEAFTAFAGRRGGAVTAGVIAGGRGSVAAVRAARGFYRTLRDAPARIAALEQRVEELEAELASLKATGAQGGRILSEALSR